MRLTVLGRYGRFPAAGGANSSYLLSGGGADVLLDMGSGAISRMSRAIGIGELDAVILTHLHGDHISDIFPFRYMAEYYMKKGELKEPIRLYLPRTPQAEFDLVTDCKAFMPELLSDGKVITVGDMRLECHQQRHPYETYGVKAFADGQTVGYMSDSVLHDGLETFVKGCDVLVGDTCILEKDHCESSPHASVAQIAQLCGKYGVKLLLAHLPDKDEEIADVLREASRYCEAYVAEEGREYTIE